MKKRWLWILALSAVALVGALIGYREAKLRIPQEQFGQSAWQQVEPNNSGDWRHITARQKMVNDLVGSVLPGRKRMDILDLLGQPDGYNCIGPSDPRRLTYYLGVERTFIFDHRGVAFSPDPEELVILLDDEDRFKGWYVDGSHRWRSIVDDRAREYLVNTED